MLRRVEELLGPPGECCHPTLTFFSFTLSLLSSFTLSLFCFTLSLSIPLFCWLLLFCFSLSMRRSSPWSSWGMLSPHSHFFPFTLSLFCFTPSLFIFLFCLPPPLGISFHSHFLFLLLNLHSIFDLGPSQVGSH